MASTHPTGDVAGTPRHSPPAWTAVRVARPARDLARSTRFYRDLVGLPVLGGFEGHDGYDGVFFGLPGGGELEVTTGRIESANPYWNRWGQTFLDPDGYRLVVAAADRGTPA